MTVEEAVQLGADIMVKWEDRRKELREDARQMRSVMETVRDAGHIGPLECEAMAADFEATAARFIADLYVYHSKATLRCQALGIDLPVMRDGGR